VDEPHRRAWDALGLGPRWRLRDPVVGETPEAVQGDVATDLPLPVGAADEGHAAAVSAEIDGVRVAAAAPSAAADAPVAGPLLRDRAIAGMTWPALQEAVSGCTACALSAARRRTVFGAGPRPAPWMLVGEAPGEQEDACGEPFVGDAGRLLEQMLAAIGIDRPRDAFITNVLKCRPPRNRDPLPEEVGRCEPHLLRQVELVAPRMILVLGRFAAQSLLATDATIASLRGRVHRYRVGGQEIPLVVTYHPAYLLRTLSDKSKAWSDLRLARRTFDGTGG
jgi:uracil-DNA glycosylase family 4